MLQKVAFYNVKGHLSPSERRPFSNTLIFNVYRAACFFCTRQALLADFFVLLQYLRTQAVPI
jgi:hypothetical protein